RVGDLRGADCRQLVFTCRATGLKVTTVRGIVRTLSTILSQAVEDELLPANPALCMGKYLRAADDAEPAIEPFSREDVALLLAVKGIRGCSAVSGPACGPASCSGCNGGDVNWRHSFILVQRNVVRGELTTPKNHQRGAWTCRGSCVPCCGFGGVSSAPRGSRW